MADSRKIIDRIIDEQTDKVVRAVTLTFWTSVVKYTPVDTGRARAGWQVTKDRPSQRKPPEGQYARPQQPVLNRGIGDYWVVNNVEYISVLDQGRSPRDGQMRGSEQAPRGMTALAINDLRRAFR